MRSPHLLLAALLTLPALALAQGSLAPPAGTPGPTMKTLEQIEPRTPLAGGTSGVTISSPGSYYLTGGITLAAGNAITITCNDVTLDLNGFTLTSTAFPIGGTAIELNGNRAHVLIRNGHISGTVYFVNGTTGGAGFNHGVKSTSPWPNDITVEDLTIYGVAAGGISLGTYSTFDYTTTVRRCAVASTASLGIDATKVVDCLVDNCQGAAISAFTISNSYGYGLTGYGLVAEEITCCYGRSNTASGINGGHVDTSYGHTTTKTTGQSESGYGIRAYTITNSFGETYSGNAAINALGTASFCYGNYANNTAITGLHAFGCTASGNITATNKDFCF